MESFRQELADKQSLLTEAGQAIEQLETKICVLEDLNKKVSSHIQFRNVKKKSPSYWKSFLQGKAIKC